MELHQIFAPLVGAGVRAASRLTMLPTKGTYRVPGLTAPVRVTYGEHHIPHIAARSDADAFRAHGVCHALDRFFQMDMLRRALSGRIAETVGVRPLGAVASPPFSHRRSTLDADRLMRTLGLRRSAEAVWANAHDEGRALLAAYVEGVNTVVQQLTRRKPLEHRTLGIPIEPWSPIDSILIAKGMALGLSFKWRTTPVLAAIAERLTDRPDHLASVLPRAPGLDALTMVKWFDDRLSGMLSFEPIEAPLAGSNAWIVGSNRSASGKPILASDPHLDMQIPAIWHLASVQGARYHAVGCALPGLPAIVIGRTAKVAWGVTNGMIDDADFWIEEIDDAGKHYKLDGKWVPLRIETQTVQRKDGSPLVITIRSTHRGPLVGDAFPGYEGPPLSVRFTLAGGEVDLHAFLGFGRASTVDEVMEEARHFGSPVQNLLAADTTGRAAYRLMGTVPKRSDDVNPVLPLDGTTSASDWTGFISPDELPSCEIGPDDVFVSANNAHVTGDYRYYLSHLYEPYYRAKRIHQRLDGRTGLTASDLAEIQMDAVNLCAERFRRAVVEPYADTVRRMRPTVGPLLDQLLSWDGDERRDSRGGVTWHLVYDALVRRTFEPVLGPELVDRWMGIVNFVDEPLLEAFEDPNSVWAPPNVRATLLCEALDDAADELAERGLTPDAAWGDFHTLNIPHPAGASPLLAGIFNHGPYRSDGGPYTVNSGQHLHSRHERQRVGASYRHVVDLGHPDDAGFITYGGQSGYVGSPYYADLTPLWREGVLLPMRLDAPADPKDELTLTP